MSITDKDYSEKRNFIRMFIDADVSITDPDSGEIFSGESKDLSGDGVSIVTKHQFKTDQALKLNIRSKKGGASPLTAVLAVKRVRQLDDGLFEIAGAIDGVS